MDSHLAYLCRFVVRALIIYLEVFLVSVKSDTSTQSSPHKESTSHIWICLYMLSLLLDQPPSVGYPILLLPSIDQSIISGIGISTDCPSLTPFDLSLGPDLPWADEPSPGNLRLSTIRILT